LRASLEQQIGRWTNETFLKEVEKRAMEFERHMDTALPQITGVCVCMCVFACVYIHAYIYIHTYMYIHTHFDEMHCMI
jgi:hypothetical protein